MECNLGSAFLSSFDSECVILHGGDVYNTLLFLLHLYTSQYSLTPVWIYRVRSISASKITKKKRRGCCLLNNSSTSTLESLRVSLQRAGEERESKERKKKREFVLLAESIEGIYKYNTH